MIVAYVSPKDTTKRAQLTELAAGEPITFRDPDTFIAADADPLDRAVYVAQDAAAIRTVYAGLPNATLYSLDDAPLVAPTAASGVAARRRQAQRAGQPIDAAAVPNVHPPDLTNPSREPGSPLVVDNHLEGIKRVGAVPETRAHAAFVSAHAASTGIPVEAHTLTETQVDQGVTVAPATEGAFRPNSSAVLQHTEPEPAPVVTLQKPATEPPQTRPRPAPGHRRAGMVTPVVASPMPAAPSATPVAHPPPPGGAHGAGSPHVSVSSPPQAAAAPQASAVPSLAEAPKVTEAKPKS